MRSPENQEAEQAASGHGLIRVKRAARAVLIEPHLELVAAVNLAGGDGRAADLDAALEQDHHRALSSDRLADLIPDHAIKRIIRCGRVGTGDAHSQQQAE